jgi:hypothetical protein
MYLYEQEEYDPQPGHGGSSPPVMKAGRTADFWPQADMDHRPGDKHPRATGDVTV